MMTVWLGFGETGGGKEEIVLRGDVGLSQGEVPIEDVEEFPLYAADIAPSKHTGTRCPMSIL
jgi:hypothetical protein